MIPKATIKRARRKSLIDVVELAEHPVKRFRGHVKMRCVFHNERTPSLAIFPNRFFCFGCSAKGDIIDWVMRTEGVTFDKAVEILLQLPIEESLDNDDDR